MEAEQRTKETQSYTRMSMYHLWDKRLSLKAVGLLSKMLSYPDKQNFSMNWLVDVCKENKTAIISAVKELETFGYLERTQVRDGKGHFRYIYEVHEQPKDWRR